LKLSRGIRRQIASVKLRRLGASCIFALQLHDENSNDPNDIVSNDDDDDTINNTPPGSSNVFPTTDGRRR
jgi:hypothetical protein